VGSPGIFNVATSERDGLTFVEVEGELDLSTSPRLAETLAELAGADRRIVLDLRSLRFMDSTGLAVILRFHQRAKDDRYDLVVVRGPVSVDRVFQVTRTDELLELLDVPPTA
jgi:anti-sigma B factor antagonist